MAECEYNEIIIEPPEWPEDECIVPEGTIEITENGTVDVKDYEYAEVSVSGGGEHSLPVVPFTMTILINKPEEVELIETGMIDYENGVPLWQVIDSDIAASNVIQAYATTMVFFTDEYPGGVLLCGISEGFPYIATTGSNYSCSFSDLVNLELIPGFEPEYPQGYAVIDDSQPASCTVTVTIE